MANSSVPTHVDANTTTTATDMLERRTVTLGTELFEAVRGHKRSLFDTQFYTAKLIDWAMADEEFRVALFRFVDVLPALADSAAVIRHAQEYFRPVAHRFPGMTRWGLDLAPDSLLAKAAAALVRHEVRSMAEQFILGETPEAALKPLRKIRKEGMAFTVDLLGEATIGEDESLRYEQRYLELITVLSREVPLWKESAPLIAGHVGEQSPLAISVKLSALYSQAKAVSQEKSSAVLEERLGHILSAATASGCYLTVDMEDTSKTDLTLATVRRLLDSREFRSYERAGFVFQAYLRRTESDIHSTLAWLRARRTPCTVRLVKGAYWDTETIAARLAGWPVPVWQIKEASDATYERISQLLLDNTSLVYPCFASHNLRSLSHAAAYAESIGVARTGYEMQALHGMAEPIKAVLVNRGYLVREYAPVGELLSGMGYLVRRLLENTSNSGFLRQGFHENETAANLMRRPQLPAQATEDAPAWKPRERFQNSPMTDFSQATHRAAVLRELEDLKSRVQSAPESIYPIIGGQEQTHLKASVPTVSPENQALILGYVANATAKECETALALLRAAFPVWRDTPVSQRAEVLFKAAELFEIRRAAFTALIVLESGKPWTEADADVAEAIDFCNYYALHAPHLFTAQALCELEGEEDYLLHEARGVCAVIAPWNFPAAIPCGMFAAALVTGNTAVLKPAEQTPLIGRAVFKLFLEAGLPGDCAAFLPGLGEVVGEALVNAPEVSTIVFTGSRTVGLHIIEKAARVHPGQEHVKRVICEMGGKNAIIVDSDADLDQAVKGVVQSVFGFAGQKCSACSRILVVGDAYPRFCERLADAVKSITVGPASDPATLVGPVIDAEAVTRLRDAVAVGKRSCRVLAEGEIGELQGGNFIAPIIFAEVPLEHELMKHELFGPVAAVAQVPDFASALRAANASEYALTGAIFSRSPENLRLGAREFRVGNLYLNRGSTGALVGRQPFGGAKLSGVGSKAGGPEYLAQFVIPRVICENTLRQGFAPMKR